MKKVSLTIPLFLFMACQSNFDYVLKSNVDPAEKAAIVQAIHLINKHLGCDLLTFEANKMAARYSTQIFFKDIDPEIPVDDVVAGKFFHDENNIEIYRGWQNLNNDPKYGMQINVVYLMHEIGHSLGLEHTSSGIMRPSPPIYIALKDWKANDGFSKYVWDQFVGDLNKAGITCELMKDKN